MKVAIVTYHYPSNYGAVLQCLALQRMLLQLEVDSEVLNYCPNNSCSLEFLRGWGVKKGLLFKNIPKRWIKFRYGSVMERVFDEFRSDFLKLSPSCSSKEEVAALADNYDAFIAGSDQIWHFLKESIYFLEWGKSYAGRRISYAPCCGHDLQEDGNKDEIRKWIMQVDHLSVRNQFSYDLIHDLTGRKPQIVADPTLLIDLSDVVHEVKIPFSEYILMYTLGDEIKGGHLAVLKLIKNQVGNLPVVAVVASAHKPQKTPWADHVVYTAGPAEWLWLIKNAAFVYTDSYHGVLFSLNNNKHFLAYYAEEGRAPRLVDLVTRYEIQDRVAGSADEASIKLGHVFNFSKTELRIADHVAASKQFLYDAVK